MSEKQKYYVPKAIDEPFRIYLLTIDELVLLVAPILVLGFMLSHMMVGFLAGIFSLAIIKKFKGEQGHYFLLHLAYWYLPSNIFWFKATPHSCHRKFIG